MRFGKYVDDSGEMIVIITITVIIIIFTVLVTALFQSKFIEKR
jgi:hypothetical protein